MPTIRAKHPFHLLIKLLICYAVLMQTLMVLLENPAVLLMGIITQRTPINTPDKHI